MTAESILRTLALRRQAEWDEDLARAYVSALKDVSIRDLEQACGQLGRKPRELYDSAMPAVGVILSAVYAYQEAEHLRVKVLALPEADPRTHLRCFDCADTGWIIRECPGNGACGREPHGNLRWQTVGKQTYAVAPCRAAHTYAERCPFTERHR